MNISTLLERTARMVWRRRVLPTMGVLLIVLTSSRLMELVFGGAMLEFVRRLPGLESMARLPELPTGLVSLKQIGQAIGAINALGTAGWVGFGAACLTALIGFGVAGMVVFGGMIAAGAEHDGEPAIGFGAAAGAGWRRAWPMIIIASIPAIPATIGATVVIGAVTAAISAAGGMGAVGNSVALGLTCLTLVVMIPAAAASGGLQLVAGIAYRACMLEETGALESFRRGWQKLRANFGAAVMVAVVHIGIDLLAGSLLSIPENLAVVFLPAIVVVWVVQGAARAFTMELWTLTWQVWSEQGSEAAHQEKQEGAPSRN